MLDQLAVSWRRVAESLEQVTHASTPVSGVYRNVCVCGGRAHSADPPRRVVSRNAKARPDGIRLAFSTLNPL